MRYLIGPEGKQQYESEPEGVPVIVDVLRASSTIVAALSSGAREVIPVEDADKALALGKELGAVTIGERHGVKIGGFDYNNSPTEILSADIKDKTVVMTTTNGTRIMTEGGIIGSTLNAGAVAERIMPEERVYLLATNPLSSEEDLNAASLIEVVAVLLGRGYFMYQAERFIQNDAECQALLERIRGSQAGQRVIGLGYEYDVDMICRDINRFPIVPVYRDGRITVI
ncbi:MAG TPA: 2-phosphosulfolactate phosphatase [Methanocella sp.]|uniref:2-phosphosulfolactate phosphatase n=1 Tax=Methanocella sp. TaxID=2052833 RepID=UPI002B765FFD|nr:2-phosphosulfolactate phosphatase [Methanocella sp.]HTY91146.1 2-phosphosulfolactate phosphatase [Methanocella sp.]